jgi:imidazolonepropionase-like amidohydrolase
MKSFFILVLVCAAMATAHAQTTKAITGATLIDGTGRAPLTDAVIIIEGTRIKQVGPRARVKIPQGAEVIDAKGMYVTPGLADMHNHLGDGTFSLSEGPSNFKRNLERMLGWGFTTVFDQGIPAFEPFAELKSVSASEASKYPHFFGVGVRFAAKGGHGSSLGAYTPNSVEEVPAAMRELKAAHVDGVKIVYDDLTYVYKQPKPMLKPEVIAAIISEAHKQGLKVYVHAPVLKNAKKVLRDGADGLVHGIISDPVDDEFIALMKKNRAVYITTNAIFEAASDLAGWARQEADFNDRGFVPHEIIDLGMDPATIKQWESRLDNLAEAKEKMAVLRANLKKVHDEGVLTVLGSDTSSAGSGTGLVLGLASQLELSLIVDSGLSPMEALQVATINAARMVGREREFGTIEKGKLADLLILEADPLADIKNIRRINRVIKGGVAYNPAELRNAN